MSNSQQSVYEKAYNPFAQAGALLVAAILVIFTAKLINSIGILEIGDRFPWLTTGAFMLCYIIFNSISSLSAEDLDKYWLKSMFSFGCLTAAMIGLGLLTSQLPFSDSFKWIYIVLWVGYIVFLSIVGFMKRIVAFAQKEDENMRSGGK